MHLVGLVLSVLQWVCRVCTIPFILGFLLLLASGSVDAMYSFPAVPGAPMPPGCSGSAGAYTCTGFINIQDQVQFLDTGNVAVTVNGALNIGTYRIGSAAQSANVTFYSNGTVTLNTTTLYATISAGINAVTVYGASYIRGNLLISNGSINAAGTIQGDVISSGFGTIFMAQDAVVNGNIAGRTGPVTLSRAVAVNGMLSTTTGSINLSGFNTITNGVSCDACYMFVIGQSNALSGNVSVGSLDGGSSQYSTYYGSINVQAGYLTLGNGTTVQGDVSVAATGMMHASMTIYQTVVQGAVNVRSDIDSVVSLYSGSTINGSVQVTNTNVLTASLNNNVYIDSQSVINNSVTVTGGIDNYGRITGCAKSTASNIWAIKMELNSSTGGVCCANSGTCSQTSCVYNPFNNVVKKCTTQAAKFNCIDPAVTNPNAANGHLYTQVANSAFNVDVVALAPDNSVSVGFVAVDEANKTVEVKLVDCGDPAVLVNQTCGGSRTTLMTRNLTFTSADIGRKAVTTTISNAYKNLRCIVTDTNATQQVSLSTDNFSVRPASFTSMSSSANADSINGVSVSNSPVFTAGTGQFAMTVATGLSNYNGTPKIGNNPITAHAGAVRAGVLSGTFDLAITGVSTGTHFIYDEVGYFKFNALGIYDDTFTQVDAASGDCSSGFDAVNNKQACSFGYVPASNVYVGRFIPHSFITILDTTTPACSSQFSYFGQDGLVTKFQIEARSANGVITQNYTGVYGGFARLNLLSYLAYHFSLSPSAFSLVNKINGPTGVWSNGKATVQAIHQVDRPNNPTAATSLSVLATPIDDDGVTVPTAAPVSVSSPFRYGRLYLPPAHGSELLALPLHLEAQYLNSSGTYVRSAGDRCTTVPLSSIVMKKYIGHLNACETRLTGSATMNDGTMLFRLTAPGVDTSGLPNTGHVDLEVNLGAAAGTDKTCVTPLETPAISGVLPWFGAVDPVARATFGVYKTPIVYMRESF
jgi:cytoskeletal protein CcmA (bactofilin family)